MTIILEPNHAALSTSSEVKQICQFFFDMSGISYFTFARNYCDGSRFSLTTNPQWAEHFFNNERYKDIVTSQKFEDADDTYWLWIGLGTSQLQQDMISLFDLFNGITIAQYRKEYIDYFYFGAKAHEIFMNNFYLNNLDALYRFIFYFRDRAKNLISLSAKKQHRIILAETSLQIVPAHIDESTNKFQNGIPVNKFYIGDNTFLTKKEIACACELLLGKSASEIADTFNISKRTAEVHIDNIKEKLGYHKKSQLIKKLHQLNLGKLIREVV